MNIVRDTILKNGTRRVTYDVAPNETVLVILDGGFYRLGYPMDDVIDAHILADAHPVVWDSLSQGWIS